VRSVSLFSLIRNENVIRIRSSLGADCVLDCNAIYFRDSLILEEYISSVSRENAFWLSTSW
jgi:hypothetical protein